MSLRASNRIGRSTLCVWAGRTCHRASHPFKRKGCDLFRSLGSYPRFSLPRPSYRRCFATSEAFRESRPPTEDFESTHSAHKPATENRPPAEEDDWVDPKHLALQIKAAIARKDYLKKELGPLLDGVYKLKRGCSTRYLNYLVYALALRLGDMNRAAYLLNAMRLPPEEGGIMRPFEGPDEYTYQFIVQGYARLGLVEEAFREWRQMRADGHLMDASARQALVTACANADQIDRALEVARDMIASGTTQLDRRVINALLHACGRWGDTDGLLKVFQLMKDIGAEPDEISYNTLAAACARKGDLDAAFDVVRVMREHGKRPTLQTYRSVLKAAGERGDLAAMLKIFDRMQAAHDREQVQPDVVCYTMLVELFARAGDADGALRAFDAMVGRGVHPDMMAYAALVNALCSAGRPGEAEHVLAQQREAGVPVSAFGMMYVLRAKCDAHDLAGAIETAREMAASDMIDAGQAERLIDCLRSGDRRQAFAHIDRLKRKMNRWSVAHKEPLEARNKAAHGADELMYEEAEEDDAVVGWSLEDDESADEENK